MWELDPNQSISFAKTLPIKPEKGEGWFTFPKVSAIAKKHFPDITDPVMQYILSLNLFLEISEKYQGIHYGGLDLYRAEHHRDEGSVWQQSEKTLGALTYLEKKQPGNFIIVPAQHGVYYNNESAEAVIKRLSEDEIGLTALAVGSMATIYPERYESNGAHVLAIGDEISSNPKSVPQCPRFSRYLIEDKFEWLRHENIELDSIAKSISYEGLTSATAFMF
jgi:hypothetical protein